MKQMRSEKEMFELILCIAEDDPRIKAVVLNGSRADPEAPRDNYQDYDIIYIAEDVAPFYNNLGWIDEKFGHPFVMQLPELNSPPGCLPDGDGHFTYLMLFDDGNRIDLSIYDKYPSSDEPAVVLLDKCGCLPPLSDDPSCWQVAKPDQKLFSDCCNEFWWCLNNVAKGIAREELPYALNMYLCNVHDMLDWMVRWYIGVSTDFSVSAGKLGKYFGRYLPAHVYSEYLSTFSDSAPAHLWSAIFTACSLFRKLALAVAENLNFSYDLTEDENMQEYLLHVKNSNL